jgi:hypothetical protein
VRNLLFVTLGFLAAPIVGSSLDREDVHTTHWPDGGVRSVVTVRRAGVEALLASRSRWNLRMWPGCARSERGYTVRANR